MVIFRKYFIEASIFIGFFILSMLATSHSFDLNNDHIIRGSADGYQAAWLMWAFDQNIWNLTNPFFSNQVNAPYGVNIANSMTNVMGAILVFPFEIANKPYLAANLALILTIFLNGYLGYLVLNRLYFSKPISTVAGAFVLLSPFLYAHSLPHLMVTSIYGLWLVIFFSLVLIKKDITAKQIRNYQFGFGSSIVITAYSFQYNAVYALLLLIIISGIQLYNYKKLSELKFLVKRFFIPGILGSILYLPYAIYGVFGPLSVRDVFGGADIYVMDVFTFLTPPTWSFLYKNLLPDSAFSSIKFTGNASEWSGFLSVTGFILGCIFLFKKTTWNDSVKRTWAIITVFFIVLTLGPTLHFNGTVTAIPTIDAFYQKIPFLKEMRQPARFFGVALIGWAFCIAFILKDWRLSNKKIAVIGLLIFVELLPIRQPLFEVPHYKDTVAIKSEENNLIVPYGLQDGRLSIGKGENVEYVFPFATSFPTQRFIGGDVSKIPIEITDYLAKQSVLHFLGEAHPNLAISNKSFQIFADTLPLDNIYVLPITSEKVKNYINELENDNLIKKELINNDYTLYRVNHSVTKSMLLDTTNEQIEPLLTSGWYNIERTNTRSWVWSTNKSEISLPKLEAGLYEVQIKGFIFDPLLKKNLKLTIKVGDEVKTFDLNNKEQFITFKFKQPTADIAKIELLFNLSDSPLNNAISGDPRQLSFALETLRIEKINN